MHHSLDLQRYHRVEEKVVFSLFLPSSLDRFAHDPILPKAIKSLLFCQKLLSETLSIKMNHMLIYPVAQVFG